MLVKRQPNAKMRGDDQVIAISSLKMGLRTCMDDIMKNFKSSRGVVLSNVGASYSPRTGINNRADMNGWIGMKNE